MTRLDSGISSGRYLQRKPVDQLSIGEFLIHRLQDYGIRDVFGIPGDYVLAFYSMLEHSPINLVGCCREDNAGFAADAYARVNGMGAVCVTYCVGGLSVANSIAGAYAEKNAPVRNLKMPALVCPSQMPVATVAAPPSSYAGRRPLLTASSSLTPRPTSWASTCPHWIGSRPSSPISIATPAITSRNGRRSSPNTVCPP